MMDLNKMILFSSFKHIAGISAKKETEFWNDKILNLIQLKDKIYSQEKLFGLSNRDYVIKSISDILHGELQDILNELNKKSGRSDYYRVAYSFPEDVMFLDIETTGLSQIYHHITVVGWIINGKYNYWLPGMDKKCFLDAYNKSKMIVTFNGTKFDCPFLNSTFIDIDILNKPNLDLMYLCRSFGYKKGQKIIEERVGFERPVMLKAHDGKEAIVLWYNFLFGDASALEELLLYNYYDILGMTFILDYIFFNYIYGKTFPKVGKPLRFYSKINRKKIKVTMSVKDKVRKYAKDNISNFNLNKLSSAKNYKVIGIDLAGVINNTSKTGICVLTDKMASTDIVKYNKDIIEFILSEKPDIVSIDAPLSMPLGRCSVYNDDPQRKEAGIMRFCERELKKRGVNVYPALIDSMQELTKRGIELSREIRKIGVPVIECFPGAAQDVLQLPRKRTDETLLKSALMRLGIFGDFENRKTYHDELDAITAALVGQFFIAEYYESIGIPEENDLIIPQTYKNIPKHNIIIGITGPIATGKTTVAKYISSNEGFVYSRYSQIIKGMLEQKSIVADREKLQQVGWDLFSNMDQYKLNKKLEQEVIDGSNIVIDGLRHFEDYTYWKERYFKRFFLIYIDSTYDSCYSRHQALYDNSDYGKIINHPVESEVTKLKRLADYILPNSGSIEELYTTLDKVIKNIYKYIDKI